MNTGIWILIVVLQLSTGGSMTTAEFNNKESCISAGQLSLQLANTPKQSRFICVEK